MTRTVKTAASSGAHRTSRVIAWCVCIVLAIQWNWATDVLAQSSDNAQAVADFGVAKSDPIDRGFLFLQGRYVDAPYIVERRGLDIFVNNLRVENGPQWPRRDPRVNEDPGDPPAGTSPFDTLSAGTDHLTTYWSRKWAYLAQHNDFDDALAKMLAVYRKCTEFADVSPVPDRPGGIVITTKAGRTVRMMLEPSDPESLKGPPDKEKFLAGAEDLRARWERRLRQDMLLSLIPGGQMYVGAPRALTMLEDMLAEPNREAARKTLEQKGLLRPKDEAFAVIVTQFQSSPQLVKRVAELRARLDSQKTKMKMLGIQREMQELPADAALNRPGFMRPVSEGTKGSTDRPVAQSRPVHLPTVAAGGADEAKPRQWLLWAALLLGAVAVCAAGGLVRRLCLRARRQR